MTRKNGFLIITALILCFSSVKSFAVDSEEASAIKTVQEYKTLKGSIVLEAVKQAIGEVEGGPKVELLWKAYRSSGGEYVVGCDLVSKFRSDASNSYFYWNAKWQWWVDLKNGQVLSKTEAAGDLLGNPKTFHLKDGSQVLGEVINTSSETIQFKTAYGVMDIKKEDIQDIDYKPTQVYVRDPTGALQEYSPVMKVSASEPLREYIEVLFGNRWPNKEMSGGNWFEFAGGIDQPFATIESSVLFYGYGVFGFSSLDNKIATLSKGRVSSKYTLVRIRAESSRQKRMGWYFDINGGYYWFNHTIDSDLVDLLAAYQYSLKEEIDGSWGWGIGAGGRYKITDAFQISAGITQHHVRSRVNGELRDHLAHTTTKSSADINLDWFGVYAAVNLRFTSPFHSD